MDGLPMMDDWARVLADQKSPTSRAPAAQALASSLSISPQPTMPASVETLTKTQEFVSTKVSILVTLIVSFGPTVAALVRGLLNTASRPQKVPPPATRRSQWRRLMVVRRCQLTAAWN